MIKTSRNAHHSRRSGKSTQSERKISRKRKIATASRKNIFGGMSVINGEAKIIIAGSKILDGYCVHHSIPVTNISPGALSGIVASGQSHCLTALKLDSAGVGDSVGDSEILSV